MVSQVRSLRCSPLADRAHNQVVSRVDTRVDSRVLDHRVSRLPNHLHNRRANRVDGHLTNQLLSLHRIRVHNLPAGLLLSQP